MTDCIQVPVEPTPEMLEAGADWCGQGLGTDEAKGRAVTAYKAMLAAAPDHIADTRKMVASDVQGEPVALAASAQKPVGYVSQDFLDGKWSLDHIAKSDEGQISRTIPVFAKPPQHALSKYQPCGCVICTCEHETQCQGCGAKHCGTHPVGQIPAPVYQHPAPDVAGLVGKMERLITAGNRLNAEAEECTYDDGTAEVAGSEYWCEFRDALDAARAALAAPQPAEQQPIPSSLAHDASIHLTNWLNMNLCECESGHTCGYTEVRRTRDALLAVAEQQPALAAAAPELLDALMELADWYREHTGLPPTAANAAIAKATGGQP